VESIEKIEKGEMLPDEDLLRKLAQTLRCEVDELTGQWQPSVRRPKDPWRASFELADGLGDREGPNE
jgi:transcriptional regulator with XRE-family HTH domain